MNRKEINETLKLIDGKSKKRNFDEAIELIITLKNISIKDRSQRVDFTVNLPHPYIEKVKTLVFVKSQNLAQELKGVADKIVLEEEISKMSKQEAKELAVSYDLFLAEGAAMLTVGKYLGQALSPRGKMPKIAPPNIDAIKALIKSSLGALKISNKKAKTSTALQLKVGKRSQGIDKVTENVDVVYKALLEKLPSSTQNIKEIYFKTTMGPTVKVGENK